MFQNCVLLLKTVDRIVKIGAKSKFGYNFRFFFPALILPPFALKEDANEIQSG